MQYHLDQIGRIMGEYSGDHDFAQHPTGYEYQIANALYVAIMRINALENEIDKLNAIIQEQP